MTSKNKYSKRSKISEAKIRQIVRLFSIDLKASQIAEITDINRNTINRHLTALREGIASFCQEESPVSGEVEVDESYFGARRVKGLRGRGAGQRWRTSAVIEVADILHTEAQAKKTQRRIKSSPYTIRGKSAADLLAEFNGSAPLKAEACNGD